MLFLKKKSKSPNDNGPWSWCDANESLEMMVKAYPQNAGNGTLAEKAKNLLSKDFVQQVYAASYKEAVGVNMTDAEQVYFDNLPAAIKRINSVGAAMKPAYELSESGGARVLSNGRLGCFDCGRQYGNEHGFPDLVIPDEVWKKISPCGNDGGLLCPSCICKRLHDAGIETIGSFMSGPLRQPAYERIEEAIEKGASILLEFEQREGKEFEGWHWPLHEKDDGYRGDGGYVKIVPRDVAEHYRDRAKAVLLSARQRASAAIPEGYVLVPREPTEAMYWAGREAFKKPENRHGAVLDEVYKAMIGAIPEGEK